MKKLLALGSFLTLFSPVNAGSFYVTLSGGISSLNDIEFDAITTENRDFNLISDDAFNGEFGIGYDFENTIRTDITYSISNHDGIKVRGFDTSEDGEFSNVSLNIYKDFELDNSKFTPYIGAGFGSSTISLNGELDIVDDSSISYQLKVGSSYEVSKKANLFLESAYIKPSRFIIKDEGGFIIETDAMSYKAGLRYTF
jgi:opacity protein-like surface antigen